MGNIKIDIIKDEMTKILGPIGKFIVEKQVKVMGHMDDDFPDGKIPELLERVIDIGVYDKKMSKNILHRIQKIIDEE